MVPDLFSECGLDCRVSTRKPQTNLLPYLTILLPLAVGNGEDQVRLRETDEFRRAYIAIIDNPSSLCRSVYRFVMKLLLRFSRPGMISASFRPEPAI
jgi:hypothetical protein